MKAFRVMGQFEMARRYVPFTKEIACETKEEAVENIQSRLGSKHRVKRKKIKIESVRELKPEEVEDTYVKERLEEKDARRA